MKIVMLTVKVIKGIGYPKMKIQNSQKKVRHGLEHHEGK